MDKKGEVICPVCNASFEIETELYDEGDVVVCPFCSSELVIVEMGERIVVDVLEEGEEESSFYDEVDDEDFEEDFEEYE